MIVYLVLGFSIGFAAGLFGVGGGFLLVPSLVILGLPIYTAIGTSLACISVSALASAYTHIRSGRVLYRVVLLKELFSVPSAMLGAYLSAYFPERLLKIVFGALLLYLSVSMFRSKKVEHDIENARIQYKNVPLVGVIAGLVSGLLGVSGGILNVPLFHTLVGIPIKYAVGTSSLSLLFTALAGTFEHWRLGHLRLEVVLLLAPGLIIGGRLGAKSVSKIDSRSLKVAFSALLVLVAIKMLL
nr:sulfite exporter TauE/SafE family protein [Thermococcus stetteri]